MHEELHRRALRRLLGDAMADAAAPHPAPKQERVPLRDDRLNAARPSEAPTTAGALFIIGPPRAAPLPCMIERE